MQDVTREQQGADDKALSLLLAQFMIKAAAVGNPEDVRSWPILEPFRSHIAAVTAYTGRYGDPHLHTDLMTRLALLLFAKATYDEAEPLMRRVLVIDEASYGPDHPKIAIALNNLAQLLKDTNRLVEAEPMMRRALAIDEASYGPDHPEVAIALNNLAAHLLKINRLAEAEPLMRRALTIHEASYGPDHPDVATPINNLAQLLQDTNRLQEAEPLSAVYYAFCWSTHPMVIFILS